jgi:hypothetical protein
VGILLAVADDIKIPAALTPALDHSGLHSSSVAKRLLIGAFLGIVALLALGVLAFLAVQQAWLLFSLLAVTFPTVAAIAIYLKWFSPDDLGDDMPADLDRIPESARHTWWLRAIEGLFLMWALALTVTTVSLLVRTSLGDAWPFLTGAVCCWVILAGLIAGWMPSKFTL